MCNLSVSFCTGNFSSNPFYLSAKKVQTSDAQWALSVRRGPSIKLKLASINCSQLLTKPTARRSFEVNSPDVSRLCFYRHQSFLCDEALHILFHVLIAVCRCFSKSFSGQFKFLVLSIVALKQQFSKVHNVRKVKQSLDTSLNRQREEN